MEEIDAGDNGIPTHDGEARYKITTTLGSRVAGLRPSWNDEVQDFDAGFYKAMDLVLPEFLDRIRYYAKVWWPARGRVAEAIENRFKVCTYTCTEGNGRIKHQCPQVDDSGRIIVFESSGCPYKEHLFELEEEQSIQGQLLYAVFPDDQNGTWRVMAVPKKDRQFESRLALHSDWRALRDDVLSDKAGIEGCVFVHASGFIGGNKTKEGALKMAVKSMKANQK